MKTETCGACIHFPLCYQVWRVEARNPCKHIHDGNLGFFRPAPPTGKVQEECEWVQADPFGSGDSCIWQTDCGHEFVFDEGTPSDNGAKFCLYCGKKLVERVEENDV